MIAFIGFNDFAKFFFSSFTQLVQFMLSRTDVHIAYGINGTFSPILIVSRRTTTQILTKWKHQLHKRYPLISTIIMVGALGDSPYALIIFVFFFYVHFFKTTSFALLTIYTAGYRALLN